ncbi:MAG: LamG domain-containing protein [Planctomycetota bacterium]
MRGNDGPPRRRDGIAVVFAIVFVWLSLRAWAVQDPALVAYYRFEEGPGDTIKDWSGRGNDGKNLGAEYVELGEGRGFALHFGDAEGYVDCGSDQSLDLTDALTIELWLYPETYRVKGGISGLVGKSLSSYMLSCEGTGSWFFIAHDSMRTDCAASTTVKTWNHIVVTFDGKFSRAYTDGREVKVQESQFAKIDHGGNFYLRYPVVWGGKVEPTVTCVIDDVRVYNRALSEEEVIAHYKQEGSARGKDLSRFEKVKLASHASPAAREVVVEADFSGMELGMFAPGARLILELLEKATGKVVARQEVTELSEGGTTDWSVSTEKLSAGDHEFRAEVRGRDGRTFGAPASVDVEVSSKTPAWMKAYEGRKQLNNLVAELLNVGGQEEAEREYTFENPRDGWVFISSTAPVAGTDHVVVGVDEESVIVHTKDAEETIEAMRHLGAGAHKLRIRPEGSGRPERIVVRAIPEIIYAELGYEPCPFVKSYGPYTWEYLERIGLLKSANVILQRASKPENVEHIENWRKRGRKLLYYYNLSWLLSKEGALTGDSAYNEWSTKAGLSSAGFYGFMLDELDGHSYLDQYPAFTEAVRRIAANTKFKDRVFYPYCTGMYETEASRAFTKVILDAGYRLVEEKYLFEQPTEQTARSYMNSELRLTMLRYQDYFDDCATKMIMNLGYISIPQQTQCVEPGTDFKVYMDMQMNMLANDPVFLGLYGVMWYHSAYADEELLRWAAKLYGHYCIEGKRERLTDDPYEPPHVANGDFEEGVDRWTVESAEGGRVSLERAFGYGVMQGRMTSEGQGDRVLVTRRSAKVRNRFSQPIEKLTLGRLYSLRVFVMDYGDFRRGKSVEKVHHFNVAIEGGERIAESSFREVYTNQKQVRPFTGENRLNITFCRVVFRAERESGKLVISDWASDNEPGGQAGQELAFNFISLAPYLEEEQ